MTNYERIKEMSVEEMAEKFGAQFCQLSYSYDDCHKMSNCTNCMLCWLNSESEGGEQE